MLRVRPCRGNEQAGKSRARAPAIAKRSQRRRGSGQSSISHNVYYVQSDPQVVGTPLASPIDPAEAWSLIVRDRNLTGPWAGFSFKGGRLVTPEGRELYPEDLAWLSLTAAQAQEWRRMVGDARSDPSIDSSKRVRNRRAGFPHCPATVVNLRDVVARRQQRPPVAMAGPDAEPPTVVLPVPGPRRRQRV
ncbi:DUF3653 domain-containing protein [Stenotrophomonas lactitubi]|uniref:DUF3653 domain-containing protein n=1 Tax=Stenotrophomonas lactitubi TaxID=2045214 RepID=UPI0035C06F92